MPSKLPAAVIQDLQACNLLELVEQIGRLRGVCLTELCGRTRTQNVAAARHEVWWRIRNHPDRSYSLQEIAGLFGNNHATVWAALHAFARRHPEIVTAATETKH